MSRLLAPVGRDPAPLCQTRGGTQQLKRIFSIAVAYTLWATGMPRRSLLLSSMSSMRRLALCSIFVMSRTTAKWSSGTYTISKWIRITKLWSRSITHPDTPTLDGGPGLNGKRSNRERLGDTRTIMGLHPPLATC